MDSGYTSPMDRELTGKLVHIFDRTTECYLRPSSGKLKNVVDISIDHFVPFSFVSSDEFWNLNPTTKSINRPSGERYFNPLANIEYQSYTLIYRYPQVRELFEKTAKGHFSSPELISETSFPVFWNLSTGQH